MGEGRRTVRQLGESKDTAVELGATAHRRERKIAQATAFKGVGPFSFCFSRQRRKLLYKGFLFLQSKDIFLPLCIFVFLFFVFKR